MALSDLFNKAKNIINTAAEGAAKMKDAIQQATSQKNEEQAEEALAENSNKTPNSAASTASQATETSSAVEKDSAPEITPAAFKEFLIAEGYKEFTDAGKPSTVYMYLDAVNDVCKTEKMDLPKLATKIASIVKKYDKGGEKEKAGAKSHDTVINALKAFEDFVKKNKPKVAKEVKAQKTEKPVKAVSGENWEWAIKPQFDTACAFSEGLACVKLNDKWGFIDKTGKIVIKSQFDYSDRFNEGLACVKLNDEYGFIDKAGKMVIKPQFDSCYDFSEGLARIVLNGKRGFIDKTGKIVIKPHFDNCDSFREGLAHVIIDGKCGFIKLKK